MALRMLGLTTQVPKNCEICNKSKKVTWYCIDCQLDTNSDFSESSEPFIMCEECKQRHAKVPSTAKHQIFSMSDPNMNSNIALLKGKLKRRHCCKHPEETYRLYCKPCNVLACSLCQEEYHIGHGMTSIDVFVEDNLSGESKVLTSLPIQYLARSPSEDEELLKLKYDDTKEEHDTKEELNPVLDPGPGRDCEKVTISVSSLSTITTNIPCVYFLKAISSDTAWIGCTEADRTIKVKNNVPTLLKALASKLDFETECKELDLEVIQEPRDIAIKSNGKPLIVSHQISYLSLLSKFLPDRKETSDYYSHLNLTPVSICIEKYSGLDKRLWITLKESGPNFLTGPSSIRRLVGISETGHISKVIEKAPDGQKIFTVPWRIIHTGNQLCVIDKLDNISGRVVSIKTTGVLLWSYCPKHREDKKQFYPTGIASVNDKILIVDCPTNTLHILYQDGRLFDIVSLRNFGIERSFSVDVDNAGKVWIGCRHDPYHRKGVSRIHILSVKGL